MKTQLSQLAKDTLRAFARRRRMLIALRGFCAGLIAIIIVMSIIATVDALFILKSQSLRWTLAIAGYALVLLVIWITCLRALLRFPGRSELARLVEHRAPGLREDLLSAVELDGSSSDARHDSPVFRAQLQTSVDHRLQQIRVPALLPAGLIRRSAFLATMMLTICVALLLVPDLHFAHRLTRAMLPSAALDRIASVKVKIVAPAPADLLAPHNDSVSIIVELSGGEAEDVILETFRDAADRENEVLALKPTSAPRQFAGTIELGHSPLEYRILAGDAVTRRFTITTAARPHPVAFRKTYIAPAYARIAPRSVEEKHGHLKGIQGMQVEMLFDIDQPISQGEIRLGDNGNAQPPIPLEALSDHQYKATIPITESMLYRVHLVSTDTGFDNALDPPFEIDATPDAPPQLAVQSPAADTLLPPAHPLPIRLNASDDLGLAAVTHWYRINGSDWIPVQLAKDAGRELNEKRSWDGYEFNVRPGDQVSMKFTATDGAGQQTATAPVIITIANAGFDPNRLASIESRRQLRDALTALSARLQEHASATTNQLKEWPAAGALQRQQMRQTTTQAIVQLREEAASAWQLTSRVIRIAENASGPDATDLIQVGRILSHLRDQSLILSAEHDDATEADALEALHQINTAMVADAALLKRADLALQTLLESDEADALLRDLISIHQEQTSLLALAAADPDAIALDARRQLLITTQTKESQALAASIRMRKAEHAEALTSITRELGRASAQVEKLLANGSKPETLEQSHALMVQSLERAIQQWSPVTRALAAAAARTHLQAPDLALHQLAHALFTLGTGTPPRMFAASPRWKQAGDVLVASSSMMQLRRDAIAQQASDVVLYRRALAAIHARLPAAAADVVRKRLADVTAAMKTLEAGHQLMLLQQDAADQTSREKWLRSVPDAVTRHPSRWLALQSAAASLAEQFKLAGMPQEASALLASLPRTRAALVLDVEMSSRRLNLAIKQNRAAELEDVAALLAGAHALIADAMAQARAVLAEQVPGLHEQMAQLAREARQVEEQAKQLAATIEPQADAPPTDQHDAITQAQAALEAKLDDLLEALQHDANTQDAFTKDGRERARDADDAAAMIRQPAQQAGDAIKRAAEAEDGSEQRSDLNEAAQKEAALAAALDQLAQHYDKRERGEEEATRSALRDAERELGIKREMDARYGQMERLADLASKSPQEQLKQLEDEAKQNPAMQKELSEIAQQALTQAKQKLDAAGAQEQQLADALTAAHKADQQARPDTARQMRDLAEQAQQLAKQLPAIAEQARKGTATAAAAAAAAAAQKLDEASQAEAPDDPKDHKAAAEQAQALAQSLTQAAQQLKDAQQKAAAAAERVRKEESQATAALAVGSADAAARQEAAQTLLHARSRQEAAKKAAAAAKSAGQQAESLAQQAGKMADDISRTANAAQDAIEQGKAQQTAIGEQAQSARADVERAARHEQRTTDDEAAKDLQASAQRMQEKATPALRKAAQTLAQAKRANEAQPAVEEAAKALTGEAEKLGQMLKDSRATAMKKSPGTPDGAQPADDQAAAQSMARALDELDRALNGQPDPADAPPASPSGQAAKQAAEQAAQALREAAQAQARAMAQARASESGSTGEEASSASASAKTPSPKTGKPSGSDSGDSGQSPGGEGEGAKMAGGKPSPSKPGSETKNDAQGSGQSGSGNRGNARDTAALPAADAAGRGDWGTLPKRLARELMEGQRDDIPAEYRSQIEAYYRAIAQKAKGN